MVKLKDLAEAAGVSITTASLALSGKGRISEEMSRKIISLAEEMDYRIKPSGKKSRTLDYKNTGILLLMNDLVQQLGYFFFPLLATLERRLKEMNLNMLIIPVTEEMTPSEIKIKIKRAGLCSLLSVHFGNEELFQDLEQNGIPVIVINNADFQKSFYCVRTDDFQGAYEGTKYLLNKGHKKVLFIDYPRRNLKSVYSDRFFGFRKAMEERSLFLSENLHITLENMDSRIEMNERIIPLFKEKDPPTAMFCHDDFLGEKIYTCMREEGLIIPGNSDMLAHGDTLNYDSLESPPITTMRVNTSLMGEYASDMLQNRLQGISRGAHILNIKEELIIRSTS